MQVHRFSLACGLALLATASMTLPPSLHAQDIEAARPLAQMSGTVVIDGRVDEPAWDAIEPLHITQKVPVAGDPPSQPTEIRIGYDADYIYLSGRLFDAEPDRIVANTKKRDDFTENTEWVGLLIDTYDDRENALAFYVTPTGARLDMAISSDAAVISTDWNAPWDAEALRDERGWFAEIRIPFSSLPFDARDGRVVMGITAWRYIARTDETAIYPARGLASGSSFRPSLTQRFEFEDVRPTRTVSLTPYTLAGRATSQSLMDGGYVGANTTQTEVGLDARIGLGGNVTLDFTANTDFAQVEIDDQQLNLSRLALFFPEKRLFFQERASLFDFNFGPVERAFHSRRIGIVNGQQARIYGGARAIAKVGDWEAGFLSMQTRELGTTPSENFGVLRVKRRVLNPRSTVGLIGTSRMQRGGGSNRLAGVDATLNLFDENFLSLRWARTFDSNVDDVQGMDADRVFIEMADRSPLGFTYSANYSWSGAAYQPGIGFRSRGDFHEAFGSVSYFVFPDANSVWVQLGPTADLTTVWGGTSGELESRNARAGFFGFAKSGWSVSLLGQHDTEVLEGPLNLAGGLEIAPGRYESRSVNASYTTPSSVRVSGTVWGSVGEFFGGTRNAVTLSPFITVTPDLLVSGSYSFNRITLDNDAPVSAAETRRRDLHLTSVRTEYYLSTRLSASALIQHNSVNRVVLGSLRIRYNPREGNDLYLVFNGDANQDRDRFDPRLPWSNRSTIQLKYSHTFRPGS